MSSPCKILPKLELLKEMKKIKKLRRSITIIAIMWPILTLMIMLNPKLVLWLKQMPYLILKLMMMTIKSKKKVKKSILRQMSFNQNVFPIT